MEGEPSILYRNSILIGDFFKLGDYIWKVLRLKRNDENQEIFVAQAFRAKAEHGQTPGRSLWRKRKREQENKERKQKKLKTT